MKGLLWVVALMLIFLVAFGVGDGLLSFLFILAFLVRPCCAVHSYVGARSFSFCLPGYRGVLRKMLLTDAVLGGVVFGVFGALLPGEWVRPLMGLNILTGFFVGFALSLLMGTLTLTPFVMAPALDVLLSIPFGIAVLVALGAIVMDLWLIWPILMLASVAVSVFVWVRLRDVRGVAQAHRTLIVDHSVAKGVQPGQDRSAARRAERGCDKRVLEMHAFAGHPVHPRRLDKRMIHKAHRIIAMVVAQDKDDIARLRPIDPPALNRSLWS